MSRTVRNMPHQFRRALAAKRFSLARAEALAFLSMPVGAFDPSQISQDDFGHNTRHRMRDRLTR